MKLQLVTDLTESKMYRSKQAFKRSTAREVADMAFMDLIAVWILYNEFEFAPAAREYASRTATYNRFSAFRQASTDLYLNLHVITEKRVDLLRTTADDTLLDRIMLDVPTLVRYLRNAGRNQLDASFTRHTLQRVENALYIENSNYRSVRRLAQNWPKLSTSQKRTVMTRMMFFYRMHARRSEMFELLNELATSKGFIDPDAKNPEKMNPLAVAAAGAAAGAAGFATGWNLGKNLV
jgi:hypothetical protein